MKRGIIFGAIILVIAIIVIILTTMQSTSTSSDLSTAQELGPIICTDMSCLGKSFTSCSPAELTMSSDGQSVKITIYGFESEKCHYTMMFGDVVTAECNFKQEDLTTKVLNQMFGNPEGQDAIIAEACNK